MMVKINSWLFDKVYNGDRFSNICTLAKPKHYLNGQKQE